jgi:chromate transporter
MSDRLYFLRAVVNHTFSAFGGPQSQFGLLIKTMSEEHSFFTKDEIADVNTFCQMLPGATATQTITLLGYKKGGLSLALLTLLIWITPAVFFMSIFSFLAMSMNNTTFHLLHYIQPMALGFLCFGSFKTFGLIVTPASRFIFIISCLFVYVFFQTPWVFPAIILTGTFLGFLLNKKDETPTVTQRFKFRIFPLILFIALFITAGFLSESARRNNWPHRTPFNLFENMYRFGSYVFGGADVLIPVMYNQYVVRPEREHIKQFNSDAIRVDREVFLNAAGVVRAIPGPAFSIAAFIGGISMSGNSVSYQLVGCLIGAIAIFLPSFLLGIFFFPFWQQLKLYEPLRRALSGINAAVVGIMFAGALYLFQDSFLRMQSQDMSFVVPFMLVFSITLSLLFFTRISAPFIVIGVLLLGLLSAI